MGKGVQVSCRGCYACEKLPDAEIKSLENNKIRYTNILLKSTRQKMYNYNMFIDLYYTVNICI